MKKATYPGCVCIPSTDPFLPTYGYQTTVSSCRNISQQPGGGVSILTCRVVYLNWRGLLLRRDDVGAISIEESKSMGYRKGNSKPRPARPVTLSSAATN